MKRIILLLLFFTSIYSLKANQKDSAKIQAILEKANAAKTEEEATSLNKQALETAKELKFLPGVLNATKSLADIQARKGNLQGAIAIYENALKENKFQLLELSTAYNQLGIFHVYLGHYDSTEIFFLKALEIRKKLKDLKGIGASQNNLGNVMQSKGDYDKALAYYFDALKTREKIKDEEGIASSLTNIGIINYKLKKYEEALKYYRRSLTLNNQHGLKDKEILILNNFGNLFDDISKFDSSVFYYNLAITKAEELGDQRLKAISYGNIGVSYHNLKKYKLAKNYIKKALAIREQSNDLEGQAILNNNLAAIFVSENELDSAILSFNKSLTFSSEIGHTEVSRDNFLGLTDAYKKKNDFKNALQSYEKYLSLKDTMLNEETNQRIAELNIKYQTEKKENELKQVKLQDKVKSFWLLIAGISIFLLATITAIVLLRRKYEKQNILLRHLKLMEKERNRIALDLHDNLGAELTLVASKLDTKSFKTTSTIEKEELDNIANITRNANFMLRETVWSIRSENISLHELHNKVKTYADRVFEGKQVNITTHLSHADFILEPSTSLNLFRICQEAISNAFKYSSCSEITLNFSKTTISVTDNGVGFNPDTIKKGYGMINMEQRATDIQATISITGTQGNTSVVINM